MLELKDGERRSRTSRGRCSAGRDGRASNTSRQPRECATTWVATVPGTYPTPEAGTCTQYVQYVVPGGKPPCASGTYPTREAGTRSRYVPNGGPRAYASA